jgi:hypothetical protein
LDKLSHALGALLPQLIFQPADGWHVAYVRGAFATGGHGSMNGKHRLRWVAAGLGVAVLAVLGVWMRPRSQPIAMPWRAASVVPAQPPVVVKRPVATRGSEWPGSSDAGKIEVCGFGTVPLDATDSFAAFELVAAKTRQTAERWQSALLNSDDYRERAAGLLLQGKIAHGLTVEPMTEQTRDALAQLAAGAQDPAVYALAVHACGAGLENPATSACTQVSLDAWARLDADNAAPWLKLAWKARVANDSAAEAYAFGQAARAHRHDSYTNSLLAFAEPELPRDATPLERWYLAVQVIGIEAAQPYGEAAQYCSAEAMHDEGVRQQCAALAELLVARGKDLIDLSIGTRIGERAGWAAPRAAHLRQEMNAMMQAIAQTTPTRNEDLWTCSGVERGNAYASRRMRLGEVAAAREAIEHSGESVAALAEKWNAYSEQIRREALQHQPALPDESVP